MATVFSLQFLAVKSAVKILLDHEDQHSLELRKNAKLLIKQLSTQCFTAVSAEILETFVNQHPRLLTGEMLEVLASPQLKTLCLNHCTKILCHHGQLKYVKSVMKKCNRLQHLQVNGCHPPSETTTELCHMIGQYLNTLTSLSFEGCRTLSNENVQTILLNCQNLSQLNLSMCPGITDQVFNIPLPSQQLRASTGSNVSCTTSHKVGSALPGQHLSAVDVSSNQNLTSTCIRYLVTLCGASLQVLNVSCTGMDCTLLWYLCGYSWYDAVELASNLQSQSTSGNVMSHLIRDYHLLKAELNRQMESANEHEELQLGDDEAGSQEDDRAVTQQDKDDAAAPKPTEESRMLPQPKEDDDGAVVKPKGDASVECRPTQNEEIDDKNILHIDDVDLNFKESSCPLKDANAISDYASSQDIVNSTQYSVNFPPVSANTPTDGNTAPDNDDASSDNTDSSSDSVSDQSDDNGQKPKISFSLLSHHDEILDGLVSEFVENMLQQIRHSCLEYTHKIYEGDNDDDIVTHKKPNEQECQELFKAASYEASSKNLKVIPDQSSDSAVAAPTTSKDNPRPCQWTRNFIPNIKDLDICNIDFDDNLGEICLQEFLKINKGLVKLNLSWRAVSDDMLSSVQDSLTNLRWLSLSECEKITSHGLASLLGVCKNLTHLSMEGMYFISDIALYPLFKQDGRCGVCSLKLSETYITDNSLNRIAKYLGPKLTVLHLNWCEEISDAGLSDITANCPHLTDFAIRQCTTSKSTLIQLAENCPNLKSLNVAAVDCLVDDVMITMTTRLSLLNTIDVSWNSDLTDVAICSLFINCPLLHDVCLDGLKPITSKPFLPIIAELFRWRRCQALIKLKLKEQKLLKKIGEPQLSSDEEYEDLFIPTRSTTYALHLRYLSLQYCDLVNDRHLAEIVAICKGTLSIKDYYGEQIVPKLLDYR
ncbi:uncharacterized protein LOC117104259 [Anneissia japonica]|uniref:uncharacterized protein LOC117104259 n=1 Tax=Anneissia japonica TaxID=1529436 RepID=UPI0014256758|nr:uncharacterized protein LOC117104259 [Anneissia japonica]XP_033100870.1 uncharacterized protein LOC117104259 [Anneissia japonica]XP_033100871.1 uncharacterized protein LOC117104259 [Anneissia japonica]XP_033100873.1 uncharacterized protein LOC117104259 [Anneissia japonica]XP_033100874.1 uncharacterized protein LOC117104259 [Anneissia japonica]XP_033100875.1 uncharacterized protein LOC117104259 [Anneissia japonica]XP_033100876.1 uncharacterized protein LOC117104259 [Anneissia japonica]XP_0